MHVLSFTNVKDVKQYSNQRRVIAVYFVHMARLNVHLYKQGKNAVKIGMKRGFDSNPVSRTFSGTINEYRQLMTILFRRNPN
jgi:hypothetical protein